MEITSIAQILTSHERFNTETMIELPSWPAEMKLEGDLRQWQAVISEGEQLVAAIWYSKAGKLQIDDYPFDQMVLVLEGTVTLHPVGAHKATYREGDAFVLPKGFQGTWEMAHEYKELIIVEKNAWVELEGA